MHWLPALRRDSPCGRCAVTLSAARVSSTRAPCTEFSPDPVVSGSLVHCGFVCARHPALQSQTGKHGAGRSHGGGLQTWGPRLPQIHRTFAQKQLSAVPMESGRVQYTPPHRRQPLWVMPPRRCPPCRRWPASPSPLPWQHASQHAHLVSPSAGRLNPTDVPAPACGP